MVNSQEYPIKVVYHFDVRKLHTSDQNTLKKGISFVTNQTEAGSDRSRPDSGNASAESFNAKVKAFRAEFRGVRDV